MVLQKYLIIGIITGIILTSTLGFVILKPDINFIKEEKSFDIPDECGIIMGNLIHPIKDEDTCKMKCRAKCSSIDMNLKEIDFTQSINTCNSCKCYCK